MVNDVQREDGTYAGDPIRPGFFTNLLRAPGPKRRRNVLILAAVVVVVALVVSLGLLLFPSMSRQSQSYKDGYSVTSAPLIVGDLVYTGVAGGEFGARLGERADVEMVHPGQDPDVLLHHRSPPRR